MSTFHLVVCQVLCTLSAERLAIMLRKGEGVAGLESRVMACAQGDGRQHIACPTSVFGVGWVGTYAGRAHALVILTEVKP